MLKPFLNIRVKVCELTYKKHDAYTGNPGIFSLK